MKRQIESPKQTGTLTINEEKRKTVKMRERKEELKERVSQRERKTERNQEIERDEDPERERWDKRERETLEG